LPFVLPSPVAFVVRFLFTCLPACLHLCDGAHRVVYVGVKGSEAAFVAAGYLDKWVKRGMLGMGTAMLMGKGKHLKANKVKVSADRYTAAGDAGGYPVKAEAAVKTGRHRWGLALAGGRGHDQSNNPPPAMAVGIARSNVDTNTPYASLLAQGNNNNGSDGDGGNGGNGGNDGGNDGRVCWGIWLHTRDRDWLKNQEQEQDAQQNPKPHPQEPHGGQAGAGAAGGDGSGEAGSSSNNSDNGDGSGDDSNDSDGKNNNNNNNNNSIGGNGGDDDGERHRAGGPDAFMLPCDATVELDCDAGTLSIGIGAAAGGDDDAQMEMTVVSRNLPKNQPMSLVCTTHDETCSMRIVSYETAVGAK
jgi:hypothetical protein